MDRQPRETAAPAPPAPAPAPAPKQAAPAPAETSGDARLGPHVGQDNEVVKPEPGANPVSGVIPQDMDDVPEALR